MESGFEFYQMVDLDDQRGVLVIQRTLGWSIRFEGSFWLSILLPSICCECEDGRIDSIARYSLASYQCGYPSYMLRYP